MCGLVAIHDSTEPVNESALRAGLEVLHHRGPDSQGMWLSPESSVGLGHTRLSIIDLATGDQPLVNEDGSVHAVVNGEFYDFERIRAELERRGHRFRTRSDSEILLHLYEDLGFECLHALRGEFAFVLWDARQRLLFAGRDRFGIKPLFWSQAGSRVWLASEVKALHSAGVPAAWDPEGFWQTVAAGITTRSVFKSISALEPGHYLVVHGSELSVRKYWDFDFPREREVSSRQSDADYIAEFGARLEEAVRLRLRADVAVGCYLSGGIDSSSVLGLMAKAAPGRVRAFSLSFDHEMYDEGALAEEMAAKVGAQFTCIPVRHDEIADHMSDTVWHTETMFVNGGTTAKYLLSREVRAAGFKVVLTGEGSDELLAGYPFFRMDMLRHAAPSGMGADAQSALNESNIASRGLMLTTDVIRPVPAFAEVLGFVPAFVEARKAALERMSPAFRMRGSADDLLGGLLSRLNVEGQLRGRHVVSQGQYIFNKTGLPNYILVCLGDRVEMAHSIEARLPFLDHHLVEFCRTLPVDLKIRGLTEKFVLREAMRPLLTESIYKRQKHPFISPPVLLQPNGPLNRLLQDTLRGKALDRVPFFDRKGTIAILDGLDDADVPTRIALETPLMMMLTASLLAERFRL
jgi:asparagine synthase (glutamine-hydrolysing)